jgi:hypothetical protein
LSLRSDDLDSVTELYTENYFPQLDVAATPAFLVGLGELEDHGERGLVRQTSLGAYLAVADRRRLAAHHDLDQAFDRLVVFDAPGFDEGVKGEQRDFTSSG